MLPFVLAALLLVLCVLLAVKAARSNARISAVRRVQVPVRVLSTREVPRERLGQVEVGNVRVGPGSQEGIFRQELELEYPGPDGRPWVIRKVTSHDHAIRSGGRIGPEFDGRTVWVNPQDPRDVAFAPSGDKGGVVVAGILAGMCGVGAFIALVFGLITSMFGGTP